MRNRDRRLSRFRVRWLAAIDAIVILRLATTWLQCLKLILGTHEGRIASNSLMLALNSGSSVSSRLLFSLTVRRHR